MFSPLTKSCLLFLTSSSTGDSNPGTRALKTLGRTAELILRNHCALSVCLHCSSLSSFLSAWPCSTSLSMPSMSQLYRLLWPSDTAANCSHFPLVSLCHTFPLCHLPAAPGATAVPSGVRGPQAGRSVEGGRYHLLLGTSCSTNLEHLLQLPP